MDGAAYEWSLKGLGEVSTSVFEGRECTRACVDKRSASRERGVRVQLQVPIPPWVLVFPFPCDFMLSYAMRNLLTLACDAKGGGKREGEYVLKSCNFTAAVCTPDGKATFAVGSDKKIKEISDSAVAREHVAGGTLLTQVVLSNSGRMLFTGAENGTVQSWKFPLTGEYQEYQCHSKSVARMCITDDDSYLFTVSDDGCLIIIDVRDKEIRAVKRDKEMLPFSEEILVTKSDLEEQKQQLQELHTKTEEDESKYRYQMRNKEKEMMEQQARLTEKFQQEIDAERSKFENLLQEKNDMEMEYEEQRKSAEERYTATTQQTEAQYQQKIMSEVERYQQLMEEKELLNERWDEQNSLLVESHERLVQELTDEYEYKLQEEQLALQRVKDDKEKLMAELEETRKQVEEDADQEIEELKEKYEVRLVYTCTSMRALCICA